MYLFYNHDQSEHLSGFRVLILDPSGSPTNSTYNYTNECCWIVQFRAMD